MRIAGQDTQVIGDNEDFESARVARGKANDAYWEARDALDTAWDERVSPEEIQKYHDDALAAKLKLRAAVEEKHGLTELRKAMDAAEAELEKFENGEGYYGDEEEELE